MVTGDLSIDPMLFLAAVIEEQVEILDFAATGALEYGVPGMTEGVVALAHDQIDRASEQLDRLIAEDETWRPA